jgi:putative PIN family toxin of toxin-antitoxin system
MTDGSVWVLDTNILISRLLVPSGTAGRAVDRALFNGILLVSDATLGELADVLARPKFDPYVTVADRANFIRLLGGVSRVVPIVAQVQACRDPNDDNFLDVAINGAARALLTGDQDLLALDPFHGVRIIPPAQFLQWPLD